MEFTELENISVIIKSYSLYEYVNFNESKKIKEYYNRIFKSNKGDGIENYLNNSNLDNYSSLSDKDKILLNLVYTMVLTEKMKVYKSSFEDFKDLNSKFEVLYLELETVLDSLKIVKDKQGCIDNTNN